MSTTRSLVVVSAGLSQPSSTRLLADRLADSTVRELAARGIRAETTVVELRDLAHDVTDNLLTGFPSAALADAIAAVTGADGLVAVTPIFTTSYSGLFKSFLDVLDPKALSGLPVLLGATGGTPRHSLAIDYAIRPLFAYLHADPVPTSVFAATDDWGSTDAGASTLLDRIERAGGDFAGAVARTERSVLAGATAPLDPFALAPGQSFEELLKGSAAS